ncbi:MAG: polysaccharide deacetylase family protein [Candidatus Bathyarchaeia archaeon]
MAGSKKAFCLTIDIEECALPQEFGGRPLGEEESLNLSEAGAHRLLRIIKSEGIRATFFVTGFFASKRPGIVKEITDMGNEVANHGLMHYGPQLGPGEPDAILKSGEILKRVAGARPLGYRGPLLRIWPGMVGALKRLGYAYDSSILPAYVPGRYNRLRIRPTPFAWDCGKAGRLIEIPISVTPILRIPAGWWWFRKNFGDRICGFCFDAIWRRGLPVVCNIHSWELSELPKMERVPAHVKFNCGAASEAQVRGIIAHGKNAGAEFLTMLDLAEGLSENIEGLDLIKPI